MKTPLHPQVLSPARTALCIPWLVLLVQLATIPEPNLHHTGTGQLLINSQFHHASSLPHYSSFIYYSIFTHIGNR